MALFAVIIKAFESKDVSFEKLVAQTYDGASNMSGCYNGLQAIIKEKVGDHIIYVHCYAHSLNLVLKDAVAVDTTNVVKLFDDLGSLHNLFNRSMKIHELFVEIQKEKQLQYVVSVKRLNTMRWSSRELCLKVLHERYDEIIEVLKKVSDDRDLEDKQRAVATGLRRPFLKKEIVATAILFKEIFAITGPLNTYLQSTKMDLSKANECSDEESDYKSDTDDESDTEAQLEEVIDDD